MTPQEINDKYPVRYGAWTFDLMTGRWIAEDSTLRGAPEFFDPWNRPFPTMPGRKFYSSDKDIVGWIYETTVVGNEIQCVVFND